MLVSAEIEITLDYFRTYGIDDSSVTDHTVADLNKFVAEDRRRLAFFWPHRGVKATIRMISAVKTYIMAVGLDTATAEGYSYHRVWLHWLKAQNNQAQNNQGQHIPGVLARPPPNISEILKRAAEIELARGDDNGEGHASAGDSCRGAASQGGGTAGAGVARAKGGSASSLAEAASHEVGGEIECGSIGETMGHQKRKQPDHHCDAGGDDKRDRIEARVVRAIVHDEYRRDPSTGTLEIEIFVHWEEGASTWEPIASLKENPTFRAYCRENGLQSLIPKQKR